METINHQENDAANQYLSRIEQLEKRIARIESALYLEPIEAEESSEHDGKSKLSASILNDDEGSVESRIGEYVLAWLGNIVMLFGIVFLTHYLTSIGLNFASSVVGFIAAIGVFATAYLLSKNYHNLSSLFKITSYLLLYYFILRLYFFIENPLVANKGLVVVMLLLLNAYFYYLYYKGNNNLIGALALVLIVFTGLVSNLTLLCFILFACLAFVSVYFFLKTNSLKQLIFSQFIIYGGMLIWILGNPIAGNPIQVMTSSKYVLIFLFAVAGAYTYLASIPKVDKSNETDGIFASILSNGFLFTILLAIYVLAMFESHYIWIFLSIFVISLGFSAWLKIKTEGKIIPALYALYSFLAFSVAVYSYYKMPNALFWLVIESLLVVSVALWFKSRIIIILNLLLFVLLLLVSWIFSDVVNEINFAFVFVALISARILNWQKQRLDIKTEFVRDTYLVIAFFMLLYGLYKAVPYQFITISWTLAALVYFMLSLLLKNVKYRYMAIATFISTVFYLFIIDLSKIELVYRVLAFMVLAIILLVVSIYYSKRRNEMKKK